MVENNCAYNLNMILISLVHYKSLNKKMVQVNNKLGTEFLIIKLALILEQINILFY